jgi:hypothetical protein
MSRVKEIQREGAAMDKGMWFAVVAMWFGAAVLIAVLGNFALYLYLRILGVRASLFLAGTPGYLDRLYYSWRRTQNKSGSWLILLRILSLVNVAAASFFFLLMVNNL